MARNALNINKVPLQVVVFAKRARQSDWISAKARRCHRQVASWSGSGRSLHSKGHRKAMDASDTLYRSGRVEASVCGHVRRSVRQTDGGRGRVAPPFAFALTEWGVRPSRSASGPRT